MRDESLVLVEPEASPNPAVPELKLTSMLPCPKCCTKESREESIKGWLEIPREDTPVTRTELSWIGYALESLGSEERPNLTRWAYVVVELLGADLTMKLAACFRDASLPDGPLRDGVAARCLKDSIDDYETRKRVRTARHAREDLLASSWEETTRAARAFGHQLEQAVHSGIDLSVLNQAGACLQCAMIQFGTLVEEAMKMPEGLLNSSKAPRDDFSVQQESLSLQLHQNDIKGCMALFRRLPSETGLEMILPFREEPSTDEVHRLATVIKVLDDHLVDLCWRLEDFQRTVKEIEYAVEAENAGLPRLSRSIDDE